MGNAKKCADAGVRKVMFISHSMDTDATLRASERAQSAYGLWCGVNLLGLNPDDAVVAFDRDGGPDALWLDGVPSPEFLDFAERIPSSSWSPRPVTFFVGVGFKYQKRGFATLEDEVSAMRPVFDRKGFVSTTSGEATGKAATRSKVEIVSKGSSLVALASGVTAENLPLYDGLIDYALVASSITGPGEIIEQHKLEELLSVASTLAGEKLPHRPAFRARMEWTDSDGQYHSIVTTDPETTETVSGLISGNISPEDLKP